MLELWNTCLRKLKNGEKNNMLGLLFIFWIGKYFYQLAEQYKKNKWLFAILGIVVFYAGQFVVGLILGLLVYFFDWSIDFDDQWLMALIGIPAGGISVYVFYFLLEKTWKSEKVEVKDSIQDIGRPVE